MHTSVNPITNIFSRIGRALLGAVFTPDETVVLAYDNPDLAQVITSFRSALPADAAAVIQSIHLENPSDQTVRVGVMIRSTEAVRPLAWIGTDTHPVHVVSEGVVGATIYVDVPSRQVVVIDTSSVLLYSPECSIAVTAPKLEQGAVIVTADNRGTVCHITADRKDGLEWSIAHPGRTIRRDTVEIPACIRQ